MFETRAMNLETKFYGAVNALGENESESNSNVDSNPFGVTNTSPEVIDKAGPVSLRLTLDESTNMETDRVTLLDTSGLYDLDGVDIDEDTSEKLKRRCCRWCAC